MVLRELAMALPDFVMMRAVPQYVTGADSGSTLSDGRRVRARLNQLLPELATAGGLIFDETASKLTGANLAFFKRDIIAHYACHKPVLEVHQGL